MDIAQQTTLQDSIKQIKALADQVSLLQGLVLIAMKGGKELYNLTEAGEMLDCSRQKVAKLIEGGKLYETDTGDSSRKISKQEIIRFIASQTEGPSKETYAGMLN